MNDRWTNNLLTCSRHPIVSGSKPSPLFWSTTSDMVFGKLITVVIKSAEKKIPVFLEQPDLVFAKIWATPEDDDDHPKFQSLID